MSIIQPEVPTELGPIRKDSVWCWEPLKPHALSVVKVLLLWWDGDEWCVQTEVLVGSAHAQKGETNWNQVSRFVEAAVLMTPAP